MKQEEEDYIKKVYSKNGIDYSNERIKIFKDRQKEFKNLKKEIKKQLTIIKNLTKDNEKLKSKLANSIIKKQKVKISKPNSKLGKDIFLKDITESEIAKHKPLINRINYNMEEGKSYTKSDIRREFFIKFSLIDIIMGYLVKQGNVKQEIVNGFVRYSK